jgi:hypothetical protein
MASGGKKKTTMAKLNRESKLRERRLDKQARKDARKLAASQPDELAEPLTDQFGNPVEIDEFPVAIGEPVQTGAAG